MKKTTISAIVLSTLLPLTAVASDLTVSNDTDLNATGIVNGGMCTSAFGDQGIIKAHSSITIYQTQLQIACGMNTSNCTTDLYMTNDCTGAKVGTVTVDVNTGITKIETFSHFKLVSTDPSQVQILSE